jgi:hypothetical protein
LQCSWLKQTKSIFKDLHCCAICGVTKLSNRNMKYHFLHNTYLDGVTPMQGCTPYSTTNTYIAKTHDKRLGGQDDSLHSMSFK